MSARSKTGRTRHLMKAAHGKGYDMQKITPFLWFDDKAEEAVNFYISIFRNSRIVSVSRYGDAGPGPSWANW